MLNLTVSHSLYQSTRRKNGKNDGQLFLETCNEALGMESGKIAILSATKSHTKITSPEYARLNSQIGGGAWCHPSIHPNDFDQFYQIELPHIGEIRSIGLQGRHRGLEGVEKAKLNVSLTGEEWFDAGIIGGSNKDNPEMVVIHEVDPIHAKFVRFIPVSSVITPVCLRLELYGQGLKYGSQKLIQLSSLNLLKML